MAEDKTFLGTGWGFPPTFFKQNKSVEMISETDDINSSLHILLSTGLGERIMQPKYGCNLNVLLYEPINETLKTYVGNLVKTAILDYEPRIMVENITIDTDRDTEGILLIKIDYKVRATNSRNNYVYPYYKNEGTNI
jgi:uncharacterized protein